MAPGTVEFVGKLGVEQSGGSGGPGRLWKVIDLGWQGASWLLGLALTTQKNGINTALGLASAEKVKGLTNFMPGLS